MAEEAKYTLTDLTPEEAKVVSADIDAILAKHSCQLAVSPLINPNGTLGAKVEVFKKVELVPKGAVVSPYTPKTDGEIPEAPKAA